MAPQTFEVTAEREGRWWVFEIPELGTGGQAASLAELEFEAQGVAAMWLNVPPTKVRVVVTVKGQDEALAAWAAAERAEQAARVAQAAAAKERRTILSRLRDLGWSAADVGQFFGISKQRVYQIAKVETPTGVVMIKTKAGKRGQLSTIEQVETLKTVKRAADREVAAHGSGHARAKKVPERT